MSKTSMFSIERTQLPAGKIHENVRMEMPTIITTKNFKKGIKFVFVNDGDEEFSHFIWESDNKFRINEQNAGVSQILSCFVPLSEVTNRFRALDAEVDPDELSLDEMVELYYKYVIMHFLAKADLSTRLDIKVIYSHHDNSPSFPSATGTSYKFICVHGKDKLEFSKETFNPKHKRYPGALKEPQTANDIDDSDSEEYMDAPVAPEAESKARIPAPTQQLSPMDVDAILSEREAKEEKKTLEIPKEEPLGEIKPEAKIESIIKPAEREAIFEKRKTPVLTEDDDPFGAAMDLPEDEDPEYPV